MMSLCSQNKLSWVIVTGACVRALLFAITPLREVLERRPELTSPSTSYRSREFIGSDLRLTFSQRRSVSGTA